jgi:signal recognition particle subunit SRP54
MQELRSAIEPGEVIYVIDGMIGQGACDQAKTFAEAVIVGSIIITELGLNTKGGRALSAVAATQWSIAYVGTGENMAMLEELEARGFVSRMLGFGHDGLPGREIDEIDKDKQKQIARGASKGSLYFESDIRNIKRFLKWEISRL